jgi:DNA topoisomerase III
MSVSRRENGRDTECEFKWRRGHIFEFPVALAIYELVLDEPIARVTDIKKKPAKKWFVLSTWNTINHDEYNFLGSHFR